MISEVIKTYRIVQFVGYILVLLGDYYERQFYFYNKYVIYISVQQTILDYYYQSK